MVIVIVLLPSLEPLPLRHVQAPVHNLLQILKLPLVQHLEQHHAQAPEQFLKLHHRPQKLQLLM